MRRSFFSFWVFLFGLIAFVGAARAQSVHWDPPGGSLPINQTTELQLVFENCEASGEPGMPSVRGFTFQRLGQSSNTSIINGRVSRQESLTYAVRATERAKITVPAFGVETDKGRLTVPAVSFDVGDATVGQNAVALDTVANAKFSPPAEVWTGEVFPLNYTLSVARRYFYQLGSNLEWNSAPVTIEEWAKPELFESSVNGEARITVVYKTRGYAKAAGKVTFNGATQLVNLATGSSNFGFFNRPTLEQYSIPSNRPVLTVKPLPANAPADFNGAVGQFKLESKVIPSGATVGEPITWTLTLTGSGNWPDIAGLPSRNVSKDFRVVQPQAKKTPKEGTLFDASLTEDVVLIPTKAGNYTLGPISWTYFDPAKGEYQSATTAPVTIAVSAIAAPPAATPPTATPAPASDGSSPKQTAPRETAPQVAAPGLPSGIPRDPLPGSGSAYAPLPNRLVVVGSLIPVVVLLLYWFALAWRRAQKTDPVLPQRKAYARLAEILSELRSASNRAKIITLLQAWQRETAILWRIPRAVPNPDDFIRANLSEAEMASTLSKTSANGEAEFTKHWAQLWRDADRVLYSAQASLPSDWVKRAETALSQKPVSAFSALQLFRFNNLLPFVALIALVFMGVRLHAAEPAAAYAKGDFASAEKAWREILSTHSTDWIAHHNLSLALAQQDRWPEAAAHATVAFVQHPRDPSVRWNFALALEHAGYTPVTLGAFIAPSPLHSAARLLSPSEWQLAIIGSVTLCALGLALWLAHGYGTNSGWLRPTGWVLIVVALLTVIGASLSLHLYSPARDTRAALVWRGSTLRSIPTEADTTQKTTPLPAGSIASIERNFLGWARLVFPNGQTGWARQDDLVRLW